MPPTLHPSWSRSTASDVTRLAFAAAVLVCNAASSAHASDIALDHVEYIRWPTAEFGAAGTFTRMIAGDISGDGMPDAVGLSGTKVVLFEDLGIHTAVSLVPRLANDCDFVQDNAQGGGNALALVTDLGLEVLYLRHPDPGLPGFTSDPVIADGWAGARKVRSADLNGTQKADYVGVEADGKTLIRRRDNAISGAPEQATLTLTRTVLDLQVAKAWYSGGPPVIAVLTSGGVSIYDQDWNLLEAFSQVAMTSGAIAVVHERDMPDRVAWVGETQSGLQQLVILSAGTVAQPGPFLPSNMHVVAIAAGDLDRDGDDDVVMSHRHDYTPLCWKNNGFVNPVSTDPTFPITEEQSGGVGLDNHALPLVADLDLDGFADVVAAVQTTESYSVFSRAQSSEPMLTSYEFFQDYTTLDLPNGAPGLPVGLKFKWDEFPSDAHGVEVVVWEQEYAAPTYDQPPDPISLTHYYFAAPEPPGLDGHVAIAQMELEMPDADEACFASVYWLEVRAVKGVNALTTVGPTYVAALVSYPDRAADISQNGLRLLTTGSAVACSETSPEHLNDGHTALGNQRAPCVAPCHKTPKFGSGVIPKVNPPEPIQRELTIID